MKDTDVVVTGVPRSGTTLTCYLLNKVADTVALHEPLLWAEFPNLSDRQAVCDGIGRFFQETRRTCLTSGTAISKQTGGKVPDNPMGDFPGLPAFFHCLTKLLPEQIPFAGIALRQPRVSRDVIAVEKPLSPEFLLCIKHTGPFTALLPDLLRRLPCYAVVRHPLPVLASWNSINFAPQKGHMFEAERLNPELAAELAAIKDRFARQIHLLTWFFATYQTHLDPSHILRYEDIVASGGRALAAITPGAAALNEPLDSRNRNKLYDVKLVRQLAELLRRTDSPFWDFYSRASLGSRGDGERHEFIQELGDFRL